MLKCITLSGYASLVRVAKLSIALENELHTTETHSQRGSFY